LSSIVLKDLVKKFGGLEAVKGVSFDVREGEIFGFLGPNGAGKTTTINVLCTLLRPTSGSATVNGYDVVTQRKEVRRSIGLVFQEPTLDDYLTAEQNILFHAYAYGVPRNERRSRSRELMALLELWDRRKDRIRTFSGGMKRRLEIVRGLIHHPRVLFLDEPTLGLDPQTRRRIWEYIVHLRRNENITVFMTTHYMDEAEYCDRIAIIDHGEIVALDTPDNLKDGVSRDLVILKAENNESALTELRERFSVEAEERLGLITIRVRHGEEFLPKLMHGFRNRLLSISLRRPTLDDVFLDLTGREIRDETLGESEQMRQAMRSRYR
jgi:ABC-2 type transport system ATP-binding protein